jgi:hypothetical protein
VGPAPWVLGHQLRLIRHLVEVLVHDVRLVDGLTVHDDHRYLAGGADAEKLLALVREVDLVGLEVCSLLVQHYSCAPSVGASLGVVKFGNHRLVS